MSFSKILGGFVCRVFSFLVAVGFKVLAAIKGLLSSRTSFTYDAVTQSFLELGMVLRNRWLVAV